MARQACLQFGDELVEAAVVEVGDRVFQLAYERDDVPKLPSSLEEAIAERIRPLPIFSRSRTV